MHGPRKGLGLSCNEYCIADAIYFLSKQKGWCYSSKEGLGQFLGVTKQTVINAIKKLVSKGLVERHKTNNQFLRTTTQWYTFVAQFRENLGGKENSRSVKKLSQNGISSLPSSGQKTIPNSNRSIEITTNGFSNEKLFSPLKEKNIELSPTKIKHPDGFVLGFLEAFSDGCEKYLKVRPIIKASGYYTVWNARKHLSEQELNKMLEDWFTDAPDKDLSYLNRLLSTENLNRWRIQNQ